MALSLNTRNYITSDKKTLKDDFITVCFVLLDISLHHIYQRYNEFLDFRRNHEEDSV